MLWKVAGALPGGKSRPGIEQGFQDFHSLVRLDEFLRVKILRLEARI
jgi:hypothetical protein